jgi:hypothetical protein
MIELVRWQSLIVVLSLWIDQATRRYYIHDISEGHMIELFEELCRKTLDDSMVMMELQKGCLGN